MSDTASWSYLTGLADASPDPSGDRPKITVLHRGESETLIRLAFGAGQTMTEHTAAHPIVVLGQVGSIDFSVGGATYDLTGGTAIRVDTRVPHSLFARTAATATLIVVHGR
ncbi:MULTISPECIES: cupin domain-containing protein [unclassified Gordonia (in: high G+C Gram-positive bacteria)]|uniref:cupin domain-containing protein n=1 Tax=unclassified Gordonia (in: high G+C Gram-positive bacteria) TaxID=2657482 RepID=UPI001FFEF8AE|nr:MULTISPECIES: cupin domain-containing protein [unclassified Gordonia (in: high G+C Gram-positive bacteria)]UQE74745.1 cupin domain-containing protein [Gordonia sp. PP30]